MLDTNEAIYRQYETLGISKEVLDFGTSVEKEKRSGGHWKSVLNRLIRCRNITS